MTPQEAIKIAGLYYIQKGFSVIPVGKDKKPLIEWKKYQTEKATKEVFLNWLKAYPEMQLGICTGKISKIIVVDVDSKDMDTSWLPETGTVRTGSGGQHFYYNYTVGFTNKARIKENIDIRADGGYVVAPPSWNLKGQYLWTKKIDPINFPINLFQSEVKAYKPVKNEYEGFGEGQRNDAMARHIGHLLAKIHPSVWDTIAWKEALEANQKNRPPLAESELKAIFQSIAGKEKHNPADRWYKAEEKKEPKLKIKKSEEERYDWGTFNLNHKFPIISRGNFIIIAAPAGSGKTTFTFDMAQKNALLGYNVLYLSLEMAEDQILEDFARKYSGITTAEKFDNDVPEHKTSAFERKIKLMKEIKNLHFKGLRRGEGKTWSDVSEIIKSYEDLDMVFIDNLDLIEVEKGTMEADRHKSVTKRIMNFTSEFNIPVVLIHHYRKSQAGKDYGADELTGSGKIKDNADVIISIHRDPERNLYPEKIKSSVKVLKSRGWPLVPPQAIYFVKGSFEDEAPIFEDDYQPPNLDYIK